MYTINKNETASFDVDAQKGFTPICPDELPVNEGDQIAPYLNRNAKLASIRVGSKDAHPANAVWNVTEDKPILSQVKGDYKNVDVHWNQHCVSGTKGCELLDTLPHPQDYDFFVWKGVEPDMHPYGACYHDLHDKMSTGVIEYLKAKGIKNVIVGGLATDFCVYNTVMQLNDAGFKVYLTVDACRGIDDIKTDECLRDMFDNGVVLVYDEDKIISQ